jgi:hypothetical protein
MGGEIIRRRPIARLILQFPLLSQRLETPGNDFFDSIRRQSGRHPGRFRP